MEKIQLKSRGYTIERIFPEGVVTFTITYVLQQNPKLVSVNVLSDIVRTMIDNPIDIELTDPNVKHVQG